MRLWPFTAEHGYALPLVLVAIALFLLYAADTSYRVNREVKVTQVKAEAESAFYVAEAGFSRVRARIIKQADHDTIMLLDGISDAITFVDGEGVTHTAGYYSLTVEAIDPGVEYRVISVGTAGPAGLMQSRRVVAGRIRVIGTKPGGDKRVATYYDP